MTDGLTVQSHDGDVNGGSSTGTFGSLAYVPIGAGGGNLFPAVQAMTGMDAAAVTAFQDSALVQNLPANSSPTRRRRENRGCDRRPFARAPPRGARFALPGPRAGFPRPRPRPQPSPAECPPCRCSG